VSDWVDVGARLTVNGLALVFLVLGLLWGLIVLLLRFDRPTAAPAAVQPAAGRDEALDPTLLAAIAVALRTHLDAHRWHPSSRRARTGQSRWASAGRDRQTQHWPADRRG
jgi:Na+-transporting methylmalonyl-CoA/oxaloacetate decarboxylase gamma subunit